jgi:hypothetical protein
MDFTKAENDQNAEGERDVPKRPYYAKSYEMPQSAEEIAE